MLQAYPYKNCTNANVCKMPGGHLGTPTSGHLTPLPTLGTPCARDDCAVHTAGAVPMLYAPGISTVPTGMGSSGEVMVNNHGHPDMIQISDYPAYPWGVIIGLVVVIVYLWALGAALGRWIAWPLAPLFLVLWSDLKWSVTDTDTVTGSDTDTEDWA